MPGEGPVDDEVYTRLDAGWALLQRGRYREALLAADTLLETRPESPNAWLLRCAALSSLRQWPEVITAATQAERFAPDFWEITGRASLWKGQALYALKRYPEALVAYQGATEQLPTDLVADLARAWIGVSRCLGWLKRLPEGVEAAQHALAIDPTESEAWYTLGIKYRMLHRRREALDAFDHTLALDPYHPSAGVDRLAVLLRLGRLREAWRALKQERAHWGGISVRMSERDYGPASLYQPRR
jgi:tetratricopeptide (TPR) repeat protein